MGANLADEMIGREWILDHEISTPHDNVNARYWGWALYRFGKPQLPRHIFSRLAGERYYGYHIYPTESAAYADLGRVVREMRATHQPAAEATPEKVAQGDPVSADEARRVEIRQALRERSGHQQTNNPLVSFLYELLRDHLTAGVIERLVENAVTPVTLTNGYLAAYAEDVAARLLPAATTVLVTSSAEKVMADPSVEVNPPPATKPPVQIPTEGQTVPAVAVTVPDPDEERGRAWAKAASGRQPHTWTCTVGRRYWLWWSAGRFGGPDAAKLPAHICTALPGGEAGDVHNPAFYRVFTSETEAYAALGRAVQSA